VTPPPTPTTYHPPPATIVQVTLLPDVHPSPVPRGIAEGLSSTHPRLARAWDAVGGWAGGLRACSFGGKLRGRVVRREGTPASKLMAKQGRWNTCCHRLPDGVVKLS